MPSSYRRSRGKRGSYSAKRFRQMFYTDRELKHQLYQIKLKDNVDAKSMFQAIGIDRNRIDSALQSFSYMHKMYVTKIDFAGAATSYVILMEMQNGYLRFLFGALSTEFSKKCFQYQSNKPCPNNSRIVNKVLSCFGIDHLTTNDMLKVEDLLK